MNASPKLGAVLLGLLSVADLSLPLVTDGEHPPMSVAFVCAGLGVASIACLAGAWRGQRPALFGLVATRLLSALLTLPAFFVDGVPAAGVVASAAIVGLTVLGIVLSLAASRQVVTA